MSREGQGQYERRFLNQTERMGRVVEGYRRMGLVEPERAEVDPGRLAEDIGEGFASALPDGVELSIRTEPAPTISADADLLAVAIENLLRNAREAVGDAGHIELVVRARPSWLRRRVRFEVWDDGPGMDPSTAERAFDEAFTTKSSGSGLGLAYVARAAEAHGGAPDR